MSAPRLSGFEEGGPSRSDGGCYAFCSRHNGVLRGRRIWRRAATAYFWEEAYRVRTQNQEQWTSEVRQKLDLGFFINNLNEIARLLHRMSLTTERPSACFAFRQAVLYIVRSWDRDR